MHLFLFFAYEINIHRRLIDYLDLDLDLLFVFCQFVLMSRITSKNKICLKGKKHKMKILGLIHTV